MNSTRIGRFTSSEIWKLLQTDRSGKGWGEKALTYIEEKGFERKMRRSLDSEAHSRSMLWGKMMEKRVHNLLPLKYKTQGDVTIIHPHFNFWAGSPDNIIEQERVVGDTKCYQLKKFAQYVECLSKGDVSLVKKEFKEEYWQLASNACILGYDTVEALVYAPYESEMPEIREMVENYDGHDQWRYRFIVESPVSELAVLPDGCGYNNLNIFRFDIPENDKTLLRDKVIEAEKKVRESGYIVLLASYDNSVNATIINKG